MTGIVSTLNLIFAGTAVAEDKSTASIVVALGVIFLDAMRVGYGQKVPEIGVVSDVRKVLLRLAQAVIGILMFRYVTPTAEGDQAASSPYLEGVAIASSLLRLLVSRTLERVCTRRAPSTTTASSRLRVCC